MKNEELKKLHERIDGIEGLAMDIRAKEGLEADLLDYWQNNGDWPKSIYYKNNAYDYVSLPQKTDDLIFIGYQYGKEIIFVEYREHYSVTYTSENDYDVDVSRVGIIRIYEGRQI